MLWDTLQIFGYKCLGEGDEQTGGFFGGNVGNVEVHQARISDGVLNFPLLDWIKLWMGDINSFTLANCRYSYSCIVKTKDSKGILHYWCEVFVKNFFHFFNYFLYINYYLWYSIGSLCLMPKANAKVQINWLIYQCFLL